MRGMNEKQIDPVIFAKALADDTRQEIMKHLCCVWLSVNDIVDKLGGKVKQPTVSHHLKLLEDAKLVHVRQDGRQRFYSLNQGHLTVCCRPAPGTTRIEGYSGQLQHHATPLRSARKPHSQAYLPRSVSAR